MADISFPVNPSKDDIHTHEDQKFIFDGVGWTPYFTIPSSSDVFLVSSEGGNTPDNPENGDFWFDTSTTNLYVYFDDGDSKQWISVSDNTD